MTGFDPTSDHDNFDGFVSVALRRIISQERNEDGSFNDKFEEAHYPKALQRQVGIRDVFKAPGFLRAGDVAWTLWYNDNQTIAPVIGDRIVTDVLPQEQWTIFAVDYSPMVRKYRCYCRR